MHIVKYLIILMLFGSLGERSYSYYQILRCVVCGVTGYSAFLAYKDKKTIWIIVLGIIAILFNPIFPIYFKNNLQEVIYFFSAVIISLSAFESRNENKKINKQKIDEKLNYLHSKLPNPPTAIEGTYLLPDYLHEEIIDTDYSQNSFQKASDHMGLFLGLLTSVKVTIGIEGSEYMLANANDVQNADKVGSYKVLGGSNREILITKKFRFKLKHVLGILAHESVHHYLHHHGIRESEEYENELLTDVGAVYLGLGGILLEGYKPISWTSDHWSFPMIGSGYTINKTGIGYVSPRWIRYAMKRVAELRCLIELAYPLSFFDRTIVFFRSRNKRKEKKRKKGQVELLLKKLYETKSLYDNICNLMKNFHTNKEQKEIPSSCGRKLVELVNEISIGKKELALEKLLKNTKAMSNIDNIDDGELDQLMIQSNELIKIILDWDGVVRKYIS